MKRTFGAPDAILLAMLVAIGLGTMVGVLASTGVRIDTGQAILFGAGLGLLVFPFALREFWS